MDFLELFVVALMPVLKTLLITATGLFLAVDQVNLLGHAARHHLNNLVFYLFTPALIATSLASTVTADDLISLWFMPINILITFIIGSAFGWILVRITKTPIHLHGLIISCCAAGNLGNLLLIIVPSVCQESNSPFGDSTTCSTNGQAYASLSMAVGAVYIWSYIYNIIRSYANIPEALEIRRSSSHSITVNFDGEEAGESLEKALIYKDKVPFAQKIRQHVKAFTEKVDLKKIFAPSTIATIVGILIGVIGPIKNILIGEGATLRVIESSASLIGDATIPCMTLIIGANLLKGLKGGSGIGVWVVIGVNVVRCIILPLSGILVVKAATYFGLVRSDSLYQFVLLLQYALPSAMNIGTITQLFEVGESECSVLMLWNYAIASLSLTLWSTCFMWLVS